MRPGCCANCHYVVEFYVGNAAWVWVFSSSCCVYCFVNFVLCVRWYHVVDVCVVYIMLYFMVVCCVQGVECGLVVVMLVDMVLCYDTIICGLMLRYIYIYEVFSYEVLYHKVYL